MRRKLIDFRVMGQKWTAWAMDRATFDKVHSDAFEPGSCSAMCIGNLGNSDRNQIHFVLEDYREFYARHELLHAWYKASQAEHTESAGLEETLCNLFGEYGEEMVSTAQKISAKVSALLLKGRNSKRGQPAAQPTDQSTSS